jgi:chromosomal replication initiator protein
MLRTALEDLMFTKVDLILVLPENGASAGSALREEQHERRQPRRAREGVSQLNSRYTFDTYVVGSSNQFAHAASMAVGEQLSKAYNPLFLYGGVGLGKTHLLHAIGHLARQGDPKIKVSYVSSEKFTNDLINAIRFDSTVEFRNRYRSLDLLLIDDIQFIAGKERTQEEFFHTFNDLYDSSKQIVISSDSLPREIPTLEERLRSRFEWGLIADIQPPDLETKAAILRKKAQAQGIRLPDDVSLFIAKHVKSNIRELEGSLVRLMAQASFTHREITLEMAQEVLRELIHEQQRIPTISSIQKAVAEFYGVRVDDLRSRGRNKSIVLPRQVAMYLCRQIVKASLPDIGDGFGGKDHTTVIYACEKVKRKLADEEPFRKQVEDLANRLAP